MDHSRYMYMHGRGMPEMKKASFEVALKDRKQIAEGTMAFVFEKPESFSFKAGQHLRMTLPHVQETVAGGNKRFMTLANTPQDNDLVIAMRITGSTFKNALKEMRVGQKALIEVLLGVPQGAFALHDDPKIPAVFIAGGIGIVPAFSMIKDWAEQKLSHKIFLFYSNRRPEDAPYLQELEDLAKQNPSFKFVATMTEPEKSKQSWLGEVGLINQSMIKKYVNDLKTPIYYISGMAEMVDAMKILVKDLGVKENNIKAEEFSGFKMGEHNSPNTNYSWKKCALLTAIALAVITVIAVHVGGASLLSHSSFLSFQDPLLYFMIGFMLVIVAFKVKHLSSFIKYHRK